MSRRVVSIGVKFLLGSLLAQAAWILAVPPYRGSDEFDHAYRASSVAHGYWMTWETPRNGRGDLIPASKSLVLDGREICRWYTYPGPDNCRAVEDVGNGLTKVASAAARYNPVYYWVIGTPARFFEGAQAVYVMRMTGALLNALLIALAAMTSALWSRGPWPLFALAVALTPVLVYSTTVAAPNGLEMTAGLSLWTALLGLATPRGRDSAPLLVAAAGVASVLVLGLRSLGPLWWMMTMACALVVLGPHLTELVRNEKKSLVAFAATIGCAGIGSVWWILNARTLELEEGGLIEVNAWSRTLQEVPLWVFQSIAAFPVRSEPAPTMVYVFALIPFAGILLGALFLARGRFRAVLIAAAIASLAVPYALSVATMPTTGIIWQGRYALPFSVGTVLLAGFILERNRASHPKTALLIGASWFLLTSAHVVSVVNVQAREERISPLAGDARWIHFPWPIAAVLMTVAVGSWFSIFLQFGRDRFRQRPGLLERQA